ncbi:MAG: putative porin, partial [Bacteroidales bacterium]|nr:putative porin [Bacteroidales bacterium]
MNAGLTNNKETPTDGKGKGVMLMNGLAHTLKRGIALLALFLLPAAMPSAYAQRPDFSIQRNAGSPVPAENDTTADSARTLSLQGIVYNHKEVSNEEAAAMVNIFHSVPLAAWVETMSHPPSNPYGAHHADPLEALETPSLSRGYGQAHYFLFWQPTDAGIGFRYLPNPFPAYSQRVDSVPFYQTRTPYTRLAFGSSLHNDFRLQAAHTQNVAPRWNVALNGEFIKRDGVYTRSGVNDRFYHLTTNYYSHDARY